MLPMTSAAYRAARTPPLGPLSETELATLVQAGMIYREAHRFQEARDVFFRLRRLDPTTPLAEIGLGATCFSEGCFAEAIEHYRQALKLDSGNAYAYALLGEAQLFQGERTAARVSLRRANELDRSGLYGQLAENLLRFLESLSKLKPATKD